MKKYTKRILLAGSLLLLPGLTMAEATEATPYRSMVSDYEAIRRALLSDSMDGVENSATALKSKAMALQKKLTAEIAGVSVDEVESLEEILRAIEASAERLAEQADVDRAREEFFVLTKPMARYRKLTGDPDTLVAYCSMSQKAWVQPKGELGNPYMGQKMPRCGEVVGE